MGEERVLEFQRACCDFDVYLQYFENVEQCKSTHAFFSAKTKSFSIGKKRIHIYSKLCTFLTECACTELAHYLVKNYRFLCKFTSTLQSRRLKTKIPARKLFSHVSLILFHFLTTVLPGKYRGIAVNLPF